MSEADPWSPAACSPASADSTTASPAPDGSTRSCASPTLGGDPCCGSGSPVSPSTTTYETWAFMPHRTLQKDGTVLEGFAERPVVDALHGPTGNKEPLIVQSPGEPGTTRNNPFQTEIVKRQLYHSESTSSAAVSPAKTSPSQGNAEDSPATDPDCSTSSPGSPRLFDPAGFSSRTYPVSSLHRAVGTSEQSLERWPASGMAWDGGFSTAVSSECRSDADACSSSEPSLTEILEPPQSVPDKYSLSARAARGILRRAEKRNKALPTSLRTALEAVSRVRSEASATADTAPQTSTEYPPS